MKNLLKVRGAIHNNVFGTVLLRMRLLCRAGDYLSNLDCAALRAMTGSEGESAVMLFGIFIQLLKFCGSIYDFDCSPKGLPMDSLYSVLASLISDSLSAPKVGCIGRLTPYGKIHFPIISFNPENLYFRRFSRD
jgi:hypothetical protein